MPSSSSQVMSPPGVFGQSSSVVHVGTQTLSSRGLSWQMQSREPGGHPSMQSLSVSQGVRSGRSPPGPVRVSSVSDVVELLVEVVVGVVVVVPVGVVVPVAVVVAVVAVVVSALESPESSLFVEQAPMERRRVRARAVKLAFMGLLRSV